jgi:hypothetical protein
MDKSLNKRRAIDDIIEHWSKEDMAITMLTKYGFAEAESIEKIDSYESGQYRKGLIFHVREKDTNTIQKILIDIKIGQPSTDQVCEAIYKVGKNCHKRIIVYTEGYNEDDKGNPAADMYVVDNLIAVMNAYPLNLELFYLNEDTFSLISYDESSYKVTSHEYPYIEVPSIMQFRFEEFWNVYLDSLAEGFYIPWEAFSGNFRDTSDWGYHLFVDPIADMPVYWNESGIMFIVKQMHDNHEHLKKLWDAKKNEIQKQYGTSNVDFEYLPGKLPKIRIIYSSRHVEWLMSAIPKEKIEFAKKLYNDMWGVRRFLENACEECGVPVNY